MYRVFPLSFFFSCCCDKIISQSGINKVILIYSILFYKMVKRIIFSDWCDCTWNSAFPQRSPLLIFFDIHFTGLVELRSSETCRVLQGQTEPFWFPLTGKTHPDLKAVMIQSAQKRCRHSLVVIVFFNMSKQIGHISSLCKDLGDTAISSPSVIASCAHMKKSKTRWVNMQIHLSVDL